MAEKSTERGEASSQETSDRTVEQKPTDNAHNGDADSTADQTGNAAGDAADAGPSNKKKSKRKQLTDALTGGKAAASSSEAPNLSPEKLQAILKNNPSLKNEIGDLDGPKLEEMMKKLSMSDLLTGMVGSLHSSHMISADRCPVPRWKKPKGHGFVQVLADPAGTKLS